MSYNPDRNIIENKHINALPLPQNFNWTEVTLSDFYVPIITEAVLHKLDNPIPQVVLDSSIIIRLNNDITPEMYSNWVIDISNYFDTELGQQMLEDICFYWLNDGEWRGPNDTNIGYIERIIQENILSSIVVNIDDIDITLQEAISEYVMTAYPGPDYEIRPELIEQEVNFNPCEIDGNVAYLNDMRDDMDRTRTSGVGFRCAACETIPDDETITDPITDPITLGTIAPGRGMCIDGRCYSYKNMIDYRKAVGRSNFKVPHNNNYYSEEYLNEDFRTPAPEGTTCNNPIVETQQRPQEVQQQRPQEVQQQRPQEVQQQRPREMPQVRPQEVQQQRPQDRHIFRPRILYQEPIHGQPVRRIQQEQPVRPQEQSGIMGNVGSMARNTYDTARSLATSLQDYLSFWY